MEVKFREPSLVCGFLVGCDPITADNCATSRGFSSIERSYLGVKASRSVRLGESSVRVGNVTLGFRKCISVLASGSRAPNLRRGDWRV